MSDLTKPADQFDLIGDSWPVESESAYHAAKVVADDSSTTASTQSESATDAGSKMGDEHGKTADAVSGGYGTAATQLSEQARSFTTISAWMADAAGKVRSAKTDIASLVRAGTSEIREALTNEVSGTPVSPSSSELIAKYRTDITSIAKTLTTDLDGIGHSLRGDSGSSRTPSYVSVSTTPTPAHADPHASMASYTGSSGAPAPEPHQLPEMPRAASASSGTESPSAPVTPSAPTTLTRAVNPTLAGLIAGSGPSGTPTAPSASSKSPSTPSGIPAGQGAQAHQPSEHRQNAKSTGLPHIPSAPLPDLPAAAESITTAVTSSVGGQQLPTSTAPSTPAPSVPASTGFTPGVSGTPPALPAPPAGLAPIGSLPTPPPVTQAAPAPQATPTAPAPGVQTPSPASPTPAPRGPAADMAWIQRNYGLAPGVELSKSENTAIPALFIADLFEDVAHLHRALATLRHQFEGSGWGQPLAVARIRRGLETQLVYVTADGLSIHPSGILLPAGVTPLDEMPGIPSHSRLEGSLMVTDKLTSLAPRGWTVESVLSTVSGGEGSQTSEQYQLLADAGELLECKVSRGHADVEAEEAMRVFARASIGSRGCGELEVESARIRAARWIGVQPSGYLDTLSRWYLADSADAMSRGAWSDAAYSSEKYLSVQQSKTEAA